MRKYMLCIVLLLSFKWPSEEALFTEFGDTRAVFNSDDQVPYIALAGEDFNYLSTGRLIFQGRLPNGLGHIQLIHSGNGLFHLYGNLVSDRVAPFPANLPDTGRIYDDHPLILMVLDASNHRIINPELILNSPENNIAPTLQRLMFSRIPDNSSDGNSPDIQIIYPRDTARTVRIDAGEYYIDIDCTDGRFTQNDVAKLYSVRLYVNGRLQYRQGMTYFQESRGSLELFPGISGDDNAVPVLLRPGKNILEVYLQDPKGLSSNYEFIIDGGVLQTEAGRL